MKVSKKVNKVKRIIGRFVDIDENDDINKDILEKHITHYLNGVGQVLVVSYFLLMIFKIIVLILIRTGHFQNLLIDFSGNPISYKLYVTSQIVFQLCIWLTFGICYLFWKKSSFTGKKIVISILTLTTTTIFCFFHWKNNTLSILYVLPIIVAIPLDKVRNKLIIFFSIILIILHSLFQCYLKQDESTLLIALSCIVAIFPIQFICIKIHNTMNRSFLDIKAYANKQKVLYDKISHDELTGSFSKTALDSDLKNLCEYTSLSFIDIDKFKSINDTFGHGMGDNILKLLVFCFNTKNIHLYRNGGDEFIILSPLTAGGLAENLQRLKGKFTFYSEEFFNVRATVSIGIINIDQTTTGEENIKRCDALMYKSKAKGRDTLTIEE